MDQDLKLAFIGGGNMAEAMLAAVLSRGVTSPEMVTVSDINPERRRHLAQRYGVKTTESNPEAAAGADVVVLAIKPQALPEVAKGLKGRLEPGQLLLSILAGTRLETLAASLGHRAVVRAMPNTPAQIARGLTVWTAAPEVTPAQREQAISILGAMGQEMAVPSEDEIDKATAVSGSGPAYLFLFIEALTDAAVSLGFTPEVARELVLATVLGAGEMVQATGEEPAKLRRRVTSPGGTTAAALKVFEGGGFTELVRRAVRAAYDRARELGQ